MKNLNKIIVYAFVLLFVFYAPSSKAQAVDTPIYAVENCPTFNRNLFIGQRDSYTNGEVTKLQLYLYNHGYMSHASTGYFGALTRIAVANFQRSSGVINTGYFGSLSRSALLRLCTDTTPVKKVSVTSIVPSSGVVGTTVTVDGTGFVAGSTVLHFGNGVINNPTIYTTAQNDCPPPLLNRPCNTDSPSVAIFTVPEYISPYCAPNLMCAMYVQQVTPGNYQLYLENQNGTSNKVNFTVISQNTNTFSISGIDAPSSIPIGTPGTWTVHAVSVGGNLHYSVKWGDEVYANSQIVAPQQTTVQSSASFTHSYSQSGTYTPAFTVTDDLGHSASTSASVLITPLY